MKKRTSGGLSAPEFADLVLAIADAAGVAAVAARNAGQPYGDARSDAHMYGLVYVAECPDLDDALGRLVDVVWKRWGLDG